MIQIKTTKTICQKATIEDGFYKIKTYGYWDLLAVQDGLLHIISILPTSGTIIYQTYKDKTYEGELFPITQQEWTEAVANLMATIYLSIPVEVADVTK